jgi:hypothetical protein
VHAEPSHLAAWNFYFQNCLIKDFILFIYFCQIFALENLNIFPNKF